MGDQQSLYCVQYIINFLNLFNISVNITLMDEQSSTIFLKLIWKNKVGHIYRWLVQLSEIPGYCIWACLRKGLITASLSSAIVYHITVKVCTTTEKARWKICLLCPTGQSKPTFNNSTGICTIWSNVLGCTLNSREGES